MGPQILLSEGALQPRISRPQEDEQKRAECLQMILLWTGAKLDQGEYERANVNATDNKKSTCLHYAAAAGMKNCVEVTRLFFFSYAVQALCMYLLYFQLIKCKASVQIQLCLTV